MTPFKDKQVKWKNGDSKNGRYKNVNGFKFDIIKQTMVRQPEKMPKYFLADTPEEAEVLYRQYSNLLNGLAYNYAISTGLQKVDLFGEALIGLGRAYRDWDSNRSDDFKIYAIYRIKDALNEFTRSNTTSVTVPSYIKKSHAQVVKLKNIFSEHGLSTDTVLLCGKIDEKIDGSNKEKCIYLVNKLNKAATRARVNYRKFVERVEYIPEDSVFDDSVLYDNDEKSLETALMLKNLQTYMDPTELVICYDIMNGLSYDEIGNKFNKSNVWVRRKLDKLRDKIIASWS